MGLETAIIGSVLGGAASARASKEAASAQKEAAYEANQTARDLSAEQMDLYKQIYNEQKAQQAPYLQQGQSAIGKLGSLMGGNDPFKDYLAKAGLSGGQFNQNNPQYQFLLKQGQQALDRSAAARGMGYSGAQMKAAQQFGQGLASQQYDKEYDRASQEFGNYYNRLAALAQGGQQAATTASQLGGQYGQNVGGTLGTLSGQLQNNIGQLGNARASGYIGQANAITGGLQNITDNMFRAASLFGGGR